MGITGRLDIGWSICRFLGDDYEDEHEDDHQFQGVESDVNPIRFFRQIDVVGDLVADFVDEQFRISGDARCNGDAFAKRDAVQIYRAEIVIIAVGIRMTDWRK